MEDKVGRVAESLARPAFTELDRKSAVEIPEEAVAMLIRAWRARAQYLPGELISDAAWSMLLSLLHAEIEGREVPESILCDVPSFSVASARRWLNALEERALVVRRRAPGDPSTELVGLDPEASLMLRRYVRDVILAA
ncbi:MAG TPA: hypothetical protein VFA98_10215 [Thermoanaerobaculia bacterium]|nr:hypothetical protein [Thermoanaerobaculia bacterium]